MTWLFWPMSWPVLGVLLGTALLYRRGDRRLPQLARHRACFWAGWFSLVAALATRFDSLAGQTFFAHQLQHALLQHQGPFLIALSRAGNPMKAALPPTVRRWCGWWLRQRPLVWLIEELNQPVIAAILFCGLTLFWLLPAVHTLAMLDSRLSLIMKISMLLNGLMFWNLALNAHALRPALISPNACILLMLAIIPPQIATGALLFFSAHDLYPIYAVCGRASSGLSPIADQQMGGLVLWVHGAMMSALGVLVVARREWLRRA